MECRKKITPGLILIGVFIASIAGAQTNTAAVPAPGLRLAQELSGEGQHESAALEYRRLALSETKTQARGGLFWVAAYEYTQARQWNLAPALLDRAEDSDRELKPVALLLRAEVASAEKKHAAAIYYLQSAVGEETTSDMRKFVVRRVAGEHLRAGQSDQACAVLSRAPGDEVAALAALASLAVCLLAVLLAPSSITLFAAEGLAVLAYVLLGFVLGREVVRSFRCE